MIFSCEFGSKQLEKEETSCSNEKIASITFLLDVTGLFRHGESKMPAANEMIL